MTKNEVNIRDYYDARFNGLQKGFDDRFSAQERNLDERFRTQTMAIQTAAAALNDILDGFPQEYARRVEMERIRDELVAIRTDHIQRREFDDIKESINEGAGRRNGLTIAGAIIVTLISLSLGLMYKNQITNEQVRAQIQREAPWVQDRPTIEKRITDLERQDQVFKLQIRALQDQVKFFCKTRIKAGLPGC